jgi:hypothetical protein
MAIADAEIRDPSAYRECILLIETSEELPSATEVYRVLRSFGERGLLRSMNMAARH